MANKDYNKEDGVWRTIGGRRVFIKNGQSLADAMKESGKFSRVQKNQDLYKKLDDEKKDGVELSEKQKEAGERLNKKAENGVLNDIKDFLSGEEDYDGSREDFMNDLSREWGVDKERVEELYQEQKEKKEKEVEDKLVWDRERMLNEKIGSTEGRTNLQTKANKVAQEMSREDYDKLYDKKVYDEGMSESQFKKEYGERPQESMDETNRKIADHLANVSKVAKEMGDEKGARTNELASNYARSQIKGETKINPATGKPIHKLGQSNETDEKVDISKSNSKNYFDEHEAERLDIAKDIAKELNPSLKNASEERLNKEAKRLLEAPEGPIEKGETFYTNQKGELERSTPSLEKWRDDLKKTSEKPEEKGFVQENTMYGGTREYSADEVKRMEEHGTKPMKRSYTGYGWEGTKYDSSLSTKDIAKNIVDYSKKEFPDVKVARKTDYNGVDLYVTSSGKDLFITDEEIDKMSNKELVDLTNNYGNGMFFDRWAKDNVPSFTKEHTFNADDVRRYMKEDVKNSRAHEIGVSGNEYFLSDYGKKVISSLNKEMNSYNYDDSDGMIDYFNTNFYGYVHIGKYDKPYQTTGNSVTNAIRNKAYQKYLKEHPSSKMTLAEFKKNQEK